MTDSTDDRALLRRFAAEQSAWVDALLDVESGVSESLRDDLAHEVRHARLAWWAEELERLACGAPRHPATVVLRREALARGHSSLDLRPMLESARRDLAGMAFLDSDELDHHWQDWGRGVFRAACILALRRERVALAERVAAQAGPALHEIERLADFTRQARRGRVYVALGDPPADHSPWTRSPLAAAQLEHLRQVLHRADERLAQALAAMRDALGSDELASVAPVVTWIGLARRTARAASRATSLPPLVSRFDPLRRTLHAWRITVALRRGRWPAWITSSTG